KWTGFTSSNSFIGDSGISEDKFGNVTIAGMLQAGGGSTVAHDGSLQGTGTLASPLGINVPIVLNGLGPLIQAISTLGGSGISARGATGSDGIQAFGGANTTGDGGAGISALGGTGSHKGGPGVTATGGQSSSLIAGGTGVLATGADSSSAAVA